VTVLAETAETPEEIDRERATEARKHAETQLGKGDLVPADFQKYQLKLQRSLIRIQLAGEGKSTTRTDH
jgi:F-type H+-transporting ATPase subunit epsilon